MARYDNWYGFRSFPIHHKARNDQIGRYGKSEQNRAIGPKTSSSRWRPSNNVGARRHRALTRSPQEFWRQRWYRRRRRPGSRRRRYRLHTHARTHAHLRTHPPSSTYTRARANTHTQTNKHTRRHASTPLRVHARARARARTHAHVGTRPKIWRRNEKNSVEVAALIARYRLVVNQV